MDIGRSRFPFTAAQWQELEHQALIYKYMASGIPIPPDLLFPIKRSCLDSTFSSKHFPCQPSHMGWSCFQMGLGRKVDPEPGRCRRTDGKKWRCSKEAYPDSKYCERHMHRGKNRSRKPVELGTTTSHHHQTAISNNTTTASSSSSPSTVITSRNNISSLSPSLPLPLPPSSHSLSLMPPDTHHHHHHQLSNNNPLHYPGGYHNINSTTNISNYQFLSSPNTSSSRIGFGSLDSSSLTNMDYRNRNAYGLKEEINEHAFFSEPSGSIGNLSSPSVEDTWQLTPLTMSSSCSSSNSSSSKQRGINEYSSYLQLQSLSDHNNQHNSNKQFPHHHHQGYGLLERADHKEAEPQKTVHRFFDEWPPKNNKDSWLDLDDKSSSASVSTTRLSISIPSSSHHEFPMFSSRSHYDG